MADRTFAFLTDVHYGFERRHGHKVALHDNKALDVAIQFVADYKPDVLILGGDILDCAAISHHNRNKPGKTEGLRLLSDAEDCRDHFIAPLEDATKGSQRVFITGNHEAWLTQAEEELPGLEGLLDVSRLLGLSDWHVIPQGGYFDLGKLTFIHGDTLSSGEHCAKNAVINYERSVRFGHFHTAQLFTKNTPISNQLGKTGMAVGCLCRKDPSYGKGKPNRWVQGLLYGTAFHDGAYADQHSIITNGRMLANGKLYKA